jgi:hypothetical protein
VEYVFRVPSVKKIENHWSRYTMRYIMSDQGLQILLEGAREHLHCTKGLESSTEGKGEAACNNTI